MDGKQPGEVVAVDAVAAISDDVRVVAALLDRGLSGPTRGVTGIERVVGEFLAHEPTQPLRRLASLLSEPVQCGE